MIINQKYKKILYIFTVCILFLLFASYLRIHKKALTLKEAYLVSYKEAINWNENAKLYSVTSMDKIDNIETINGLNGKRFFWNFEYVVPMSNTHCIIEISEGKISNNIVINGIYVNSNIINSEDLVIDSSNALQSARKAINLKQGVDWAKGYHYILRKNNGTTIMGVVGLDEDGYFTKIYFNATTGELLDCEHKIPIGGGLYKYNEKIPIIKDKVYGISGISQSPDFINDKSLIIWGYIGEGTANKQIVQISEDDSKTWGDMPIQENVKRIWFANSYSTNDLIFALTENKLLSTTNKGLSWTETFVSNEQIIDVSSSDSEIIIITSIKSYISKNYGITWENINIPTDTILVKHGNKGIWLCTGESLYEYKDGKTEHINLSFMDDKIIGLQVLNDKVAVYGFTKLIIYNKKNNCSDLLNVPEGIKTVECYINNNKTDIYVINLSGDIIKYSKREDDINWNEEIIMDTTDGELMDLELSMSNILYVGLMPRLTWKKL